MKFASTPWDSDPLRSVSNSARRPRAESTSSAKPVPCAQAQESSLNKRKASRIGSSHRASALSQLLQLSQQQPVDLGATGHHVGLSCGAVLSPSPCRLRPGSEGIENHEIPRPAAVASAWIPVSFRACVHIQSTRCRREASAACGRCGRSACRLSPEALLAPVQLTNVTVCLTYFC